MRTRGLPRNCGVMPAILSLHGSRSAKQTILRVVGVEDFVAMKVFAGRPQDISDARYALAAAKNSIDAELLRRLTTRYDRQAVAELEKLLAAGG